MNKLLRLTCILGLAPMIAFAQPEKKQSASQEVFDYNKAVLQAKQKGIPEHDIPGYVAYLKRDLSSRQALEKSGHVHSPYEDPFGPVHQTVINLTPNAGNTGQKPANAGCTNLGFEQYNFSGWTGTIGQVSQGVNYPSYAPTASVIANSAGNNVFMSNTVNYHTIMSIPPTNNLYPNCNSTGYDSIAVRAVGTQTISDIPYVSPFSFDGVSVRMNGTNANYRACQLKYVVTTSATVKRMSFSYAVVLQDPSAHTAGQSPYFKVEARNENTNTVLPGCTSYTFNPKSSLPSDSLKVSALLDPSGDPQMYRKWQYYSVDLSSLPVGTSVSINFEVGGCSQSGHWGYAYVDAECGGIGVPYSNMCSGSSSALLVAPTGFISYQWFDPANNPIAAPQGVNDSLTVNPAVPGDVYTVKMVSAGSCSLTLTDTIKITTVNILNTNSSPSCQGGSSGSAQVTAAGSSGTLVYSWVNSAGAVVSTNNTATNLAAGNYTIHVSSTACGTASAVVNVAVAPPQFFSQTASYCGNVAFITNPGQSNYQWYNGNTPVPAPQGTNDTLYITSPVVGGTYYLTSTNPQGCRDSVKYTLSLISGGSVYAAIDKNVCPGNTNGIAVINLQTINNPTYSYFVTGPGGYMNNMVATSSKKDSLSNLAAGIYSVTVNDGVCIYASTFTVANIATSFTATPASTVICFPTDTARINVTFPAPPTVCSALPGDAFCISPSTLQLYTTGTSSNSGTSYPTPYGNFFTYSKQQYLVTKAQLNTAGLTAGKISSLAFNILNLNTSITTYPNFEIKMGCTTLMDFTSSFETGLSTVYYTNNQPVATGWNTHNFTNSYYWDGNSNIIVDVCFGMNQSYDYTENCSVELVNVPYIGYNGHREDQNPVCNNPAVTPNDFFTSRNVIPNMRFGFCDFPPTSSYTVTVLPSSPTPTITSDNEHITVLPPFTTTPATNTTISYTISVKNPVGGCVKDTVIKILYAGSLTDVKTSKDTTVCYGSVVNFSASNANGYTWYYLTTPTNSLTISNSSTISVTPPVVGTNTYIVRGGGFCGASPDFDTIVVTVKPIANLEITPLLDVTKCMYSGYTLHAGVGSTTPGNSGTPYTYQWTTIPGNAPAPGSNNTASYTASSNSTQTFVITVGGLCANGDADTVVVKNFPDNMQVSIIDSVSICSSSPLVLHSSVSGGEPDYHYVWTLQPGTQLSTDPTLNSTSPDTQGNYVITLSVTDSCGMAKSDYQVINVLPPCSVTIPNVITPNGDGTNDYFIIKNLDKHPNSSLTIYDRWGKKVFETPDYQNNWKGDGVSDGTFFYIFNVPDDKAYSGYITVFHNK